MNNLFLNGQVKPGIDEMKTEYPDKVELFKLHPFTKINADSGEGMNRQNKKQMSKMISKGCQFYWNKSNNKWRRVELDTFVFSYSMRGIEVVLIHK